MNITQQTPARRIAIVTTPGSGSGRAHQRALELRERLRSRGEAVTLKVFSNPDKVRRWATTCDTPCSLLICIGGDGTLNAAAAAALRQAVPFLPVPSGFGNLFASALQQPRRVDQVVELVARGALLRVDVGRYDDEFFLCQQSFGVLQQIQDRTEARTSRPRSRWQRSLAYYQMARRVLKDTELPRFRVTVDGRVVARDAVIVTVANVRTYGAWLKLTPTASPIDGLFDVFLMQGRGKREVLSKLLKRHLRLPSRDDPGQVWRGRHVSVAAPHRAPDQLVLLPHRLTVVVSPETAATLLRDRGGIVDDPRTRPQQVA